MKLCVRAECSPRVTAIEIRRVRGDREQQRQHRPQAVADANRAVDVAHAQVHVQAEGVVPPSHVFQALLDAAVVLGVDDRLLAVVGPRMRSSGAQRHALAPASANRRPRALALAGERVVQVRSDARDDLDLRGDQLAGDALVQDAVALRGGAQLLEARHEIEGVRMQDRELLLHADGEVGRLGKRLDRSV